MRSKMQLFKNIQNLLFVNWIEIYSYTTVASCRTIQIIVPCISNVPETSKWHWSAMKRTRKSGKNRWDSSFQMSRVDRDTQRKCSTLTWRHKEHTKQRLFHVVDYLLHTRRGGRSSVTSSTMLDDAMNTICATRFAKLNTIHILHNVGPTWARV